MTTLEKDEGMSYEWAVEAIELNKRQIEKHGSQVPMEKVGFWVKKRPENCLGTGRDRIWLITAELRNAGTTSKNAVVKVLHRTPWNAAGVKKEYRRIKSQWKLCEDETAAKNLWNFWYKCAVPSLTTERFVRCHASIVCA